MFDYSNEYVDKLQRRIAERDRAVRDETAKRLAELWKPEVQKETAKRIIDIIRDNPDWRYVVAVIQREFGVEE